MVTGEDIALWRPLLVGVPTTLRFTDCREITLDGEFELDREGGARALFRRTMSTMNNYIVKYLLTKLMEATFDFGMAAGDLAEFDH